jgi:hypothetical protein
VVWHVLLRLVDGAGQEFEIEVQCPGQSGDREECGCRDAAGLDLAEGLGRDAGVDRDVHHAAIAACGAQQVAEALTALAFRDGQRHTYHECDTNTGIVIGPRCWSEL